MKDMVLPEDVRIYKEGITRHAIIVYISETDMKGKYSMCLLNVEHVAETCCLLVT
jgi:hypothetical protein